MSGSLQRRDDGAPGQPSPLQRVALGSITLYQRAISPLLPASCRFAPTCSEYAREAIAVHGLGRGGRLAAARILRCHPFHPGGHDPVPPARAATSGGSDE